MAGARNCLSNYYTWRSRESLNIDTRTASDHGSVRTFLQGVFSWTSGGYVGAGIGDGGGAATYNAAVSGGQGSGAIAQGSLGVYSAFIQFAGFTVRKAVSQFSAPWTNYPANEYDDLPGGGGWVTGVNQFTYTADFGQGITASLSAQDQVVRRSRSRCWLSHNCTSHAERPSRVHNRLRHGRFLRAIGRGGAAGNGSLSSPACFSASPWGWPSATE